MKEFSSGYERLRYVFLTWFGAGLVPKAPGTAGTIATLPLAWLALEWAIPFRFLAAALLTTFACWLCAVDQKTNPNGDPQYIVIDESAGLLCSILFIPQDALWLAAAFLLFRFFDVTKPFPANFFDRRSKIATSSALRGSAIVLDDVIAGLYSALLLAIIKAFLG